MCAQFSQGSPWMGVAGGIFNGDYAVDLSFVLSGFVPINMVHDFSGAHYTAYLCGPALQPGRQ